MPFDQAFRLSSLLLATTAFGGLVLAHAIPLWLALVTTSILIAGFLRAWDVPLIRHRSTWTSIPSSLWNLLLIGAFLLFILDLLVISRDLLPAGIHFLAMLLALKLVTLHQRNDYRHLYAISLMAVLASAALTTEVWYVPIFFLYLLTAVWTLLLYHLTDGQLRERLGTSSELPSQPYDATSGRITTRFFWLTNGMAVLAFGLTLVIFFVLPRIGAGILQKSRGEGLRTTGFSERVDLGTIGSVKQDPQVVMRVELPDLQQNRKDRLYLRGVAYDRYNGRSWSTGISRRKNLGSLDEGTFAVTLPGNRVPETLSAPILQDILLESLDTAVLFAAPMAEYLTGDFAGIQTDAMAALFLPFASASRIRYSVTSREPLLLPSERTAFGLDYPRAVLDRYLQLPELSGTVTELSRQVVRGASTPYERVMAIRQHLLQQYQYSLDVETATSPHPLEDFLFTRKTGYCEHYATAMAVMLRTLGIPARLVTGFLATEWNEFGGYFTVRQRDAHAWVEVYFPRSGWITLDPTPAAGAGLPPSGWDVLSRFGESLRLHWDRIFIRYSAKDQLAVVHGVRESGNAVRDRLGTWLSTLGTPIAAAFERTTQAVRRIRLGFPEIVIGLASVGAGILILLVRDRLGLWMTTHLPASRSHPVIAQLYHRMLRILERRGVPKSPAVTPSEFVLQVEREWQAASPLVAEVTALYCRGRFGGKPLLPEELTRVTEQIGRLRDLTPAARSFVRSS